MKEGGRRRHDDGAGAECLRRAALESAHGGHARGDDEDGSKSDKRVLEPLESAEVLRDEHARIAREALLTKRAEQAGAYQDNGARDAAALLRCDEGRLPVTHLGLCQRLAMMVTARRPASAITDVISAVAGGAAPTAPVGRAGARATRHQVLTQPAPRLAAHFNSSRGQQDTSCRTQLVNPFPGS